MSSSDSKLIVLWNKVPVIIRAILIGLTFSTIGILVWLVLATVVPMPWAFMLMLGLLGLYWKYATGSWWPASTQAFRKENTRRKTLPQKAWIPTLIAALLIVLIEQSALVVTFRLIDFPGELFTAEYGFLTQVPTWSAWLFIIMISAVAGICEEVGFRGFMQTPLEKRFGPVWAIGIVSVVFVLVHLHQSWSGPLIAQVFLISVLFGAIAYYSGSLIPGIIAHFIMDICNFSFWWSDLGGQFDRETIAVTGVDLHFILWTVAFILGIVSFVWILRGVGEASERRARGVGEA
jgi:membrane protease YdiL (CAAX protease family)